MFKKTKVLPSPAQLEATQVRKDIRRVATQVGIATVALVGTFAAIHWVQTLENDTPLED